MISFLAILNTLTVIPTQNWHYNNSFLNKDTGKLTVGMTGTNVHGKQIKGYLLA